MGGDLERKQEHEADERRDWQLRLISRTRCVTTCRCNDMDKDDNAIFIGTLLIHLREKKENYRARVPDIDKVLKDNVTLLHFFMEMSHFRTPRARVEYIPGTDGEIFWIRAIQGWTTNHIEPEYMTIQPLHPSITHVWHGTGKQAAEEILESEISGESSTTRSSVCECYGSAGRLGHRLRGRERNLPYVYEQATHFLRINRAMAEAMGCVFWITPSHSVLVFQDIPMTCIESIRTKEYVVTYERPPRGPDRPAQLPKGAEKEIQANAHPKGAHPQSSTRSTSIRLTPREFANAPVVPNVRTVTVRPGSEMADTDDDT